MLLNNYITLLYSIMDADQLFNNGVNMYNKWYKFFDENYYTMQSYELFTKAKNKYLLSKNNNKIIACYEWMIKCLQEVTNNLYNDDLGIVYDDFAYYLFNNNDTDKAIILFQKAIDIYNDSGNFSKIIKIKELLAEYYTKQNNYKIAIQTYNNLKDLYRLQNNIRHYSMFRINKTLFELYVKNNDLSNASKVFDDIIQDDVINRFTIDEIFVCSILCYTCIDTVLAKKKLEELVTKFSNLKNKDNYIMMLDIIEYVENNDVISLHSIKNKLDPINIMIIDKIIETTQSTSYV